MTANFISGVTCFQRNFILGDGSGEGEGEGREGRGLNGRKEVATWDKRTTTPVPFSDAS